jgi:hypothetical protein
MVNILIFLFTLVTVLSEKIDLVKKIQPGEI